MDLELYHLEKTPKSLVEKIEATNFQNFLQDLRKDYSGQLRFGKSKLQKTPHCYETFLFEWEEVMKNRFLSQIFEYVESVYKKYDSPSKSIGLRPQIIHYPAGFGCLGSHVHDNSVQKIGAVCVLFSCREVGAFYVEKDNQIYFTNEQVGDTVVFDFGLIHGVLSDSKSAFHLLENKIPSKVPIIENVGRVVAVLTSE